MPSRRAVLQTTSLTLLSGCNGIIPTGSKSQSPTGTPGTPGVTAYDLRVRNLLTKDEAGFLVDAEKSLLFVQLTKVVDPDALEHEVVVEKRVLIEGSTEKKLTGLLPVEDDAPEYILTAIVVTERNPEGQPHGETATRRFEAGDAFLDDGGVDIVIEKAHDFAGPSFQVAVQIES